VFTRLSLPPPTIAEVMKESPDVPCVLESRQAGRIQGQRGLRVGKISDGRLLIDLREREREQMWKDPKGKERCVVRTLGSRIVSGPPDKTKPEVSSFTHSIAVEQTWGILVSQDVLCPFVRGHVHRGISRRMGAANLPGCRWPQ